MEIIWKASVYMVQFWLTRTHVTWTRQRNCIHIRKNWSFEYYFLIDLVSYLLQNSLTEHKLLVKNQLPTYSYLTKGKKQQFINDTDWLEK